VANSNNATYNAAKVFAIGSETTDAATSTIPGDVELDGRITGFHYVVGTALYTADFSRPTSRPALHANTKLLLNARRGSPFADSSTLANTVTAVGNCTWNSARPV
jgi:hypothetical protein